MWKTAGEKSSDRAVGLPLIKNVGNHDNKNMLQTPSYTLILCWKYTHRVVGLIDADQEDELREEERCYQVSVDGVQVGAEPAQQAQQDEGEEEEEQRDRHRGVRDDLQGENIAVLRRGGTRQSKTRQKVENRKF